MHDLTKKELVDIARSNGCTGYSTLKKADLITLISKNCHPKRTKKDLVDLAKARGCVGYSKLNKPDLVEFLKTCSKKSKSKSKSKSTTKAKSKKSAAKSKSKSKKTIKRTIKTNSDESSPSPIPKKTTPVSNSPRITSPVSARPPFVSAKPVSARPSQTSPVSARPSLYKKTTPVNMAAYTEITWNNPDNLYFYSGSKEYSFLSNFYMRDDASTLFTVDHMGFNCIEQYFQYQKMIGFGRTEVAERIMATTNPISMKQLARRGKGASLTEDELRLWNGGLSIGVMRTAVHAKFAQNEDLKAKLLATGGATLVEYVKGRGASRIWGVISSGVGRNILGRILMEVRDILK